MLNILGIFRTVSNGNAINVHNRNLDYAGFPQLIEHIQGSLHYDFFRLSAGFTILSACSFLLNSTPWIIKALFSHITE